MRRSAVASLSSLHLPHIARPGAKVRDWVSHFFHFREYLRSFTFFLVVSPLCVFFSSFALVLLHSLLLFHSVFFSAGAWRLSCLLCVFCVSCILCSLPLCRYLRVCVFCFPLVFFFLVSFCFLSILALSVPSLFCGPSCLLLLGDPSDGGDDHNNRP